ncbi:MAG: alkaline phosphatase family protein, partial [Candidatus Latescibacteria bacterium]|nr:alkaline phosphatase family protein [Candidatus Latescibacterota bacterium]
SVFPARYLRTVRDLDYRIDLDLEEVRERPDLLFPRLHELLRVRERLMDVLWNEEKWNLMQVVVTGTDRLHHFLFDAYEDEAHPYHGAFLDYYRAVDAFVGRVFDRFFADPEAKGFFVLSDHGFCRTRHEVNINAVLAKHGFLAFTSPAASIDALSEGATAFALDPARIYLHKRGKYPHGGVGSDREAALLSDLADIFSTLAHDGERIARHVFHGRDVYSGPETRHGPDLLLVPTPGFDLKGRVGSTDVVVPRRLQGMHTWEDAFLATTRADLLPRERALTLIDVPRMILESLDVHALAS